MNTLLQILLYLWIATTAMMIVTWYLRRRSNNSEGEARANAAKFQLTETANGATMEPAPHPALIGPTTSGSLSAAGKSDLAALGITTTDTIDFELPDDPGSTISDQVVIEQIAAAQTISAETAGYNNDKDDDEITPDDTTDNSNETTPDDTTDNSNETTPDDTAAGEAIGDNSSAPDDFADGLAEQPDEGFDAKEVDSGTADSSLSALSVVHPRALTDMLDGIELPYDLVPVTAVVEDPDRHLIFLTTHSNAEEVGTRFADELIRLGFEFTPVGLDQAIAKRGDDTVSMTIVPKADEVNDANGRRYGAAGIGDVALELWIGESPSPPTARSI